MRAERYPMRLTGRTQEAITVALYAYAHALERFDRSTPEGDELWNVITEWNCENLESHLKPEFRLDSPE